MTTMRTMALAGGAVAALLVAAMAPGAAVAEEEHPFTIGARPVWFLLGGVTGGTSFASDDMGGFLGGELSLVRLEGGRFAGLYLDGAYDFGAGATFLSAGPELGLHIRSTRAVSLGLDGGLALRFQDEAKAGATGRLAVTLFGMFSIYGRYTYLGADDG